MHTNTFTSRFAVGDKITNGKNTLTITKVAIDAHSVVYYQTQERTYPEEHNLTNYHLAPKYPIGSKVWIGYNYSIREMLVRNIVGNTYIFDDSMRCSADYVFATSGEALAAIKIIPLTT